MSAKVVIIGHTPTHDGHSVSEATFPLHLHLPHLLFVPKTNGVEISPSRHCALRVWCESSNYNPHCLHILDLKLCITSGIKMLWPWQHSEKVVKNDISIKDRGQLKDYLNTVFLLNRSGMKTKALIIFWYFKLGDESTFPIKISSCRK